MKLNHILIALVVIMLSVVGCAGFKIDSGANSQALGYVTGKGVGFAVNTLAPRSDVPLTDAWKRMMTKNALVDPVPGIEIVGFYNEATMIMSGEVNDPYGLLGDLAALLTIYGATFASDGKLTFIQDVPKVVLTQFQFGYAGGKRLALR